MDEVMRLKKAINVWGSMILLEYENSAVLLLVKRCQHSNIN